MEFFLLSSDMLDLRKKDKKLTNWTKGADSTGAYLYQLYTMLIKFRIVYIMQTACLPLGRVSTLAFDVRRDIVTTEFVRYGHGE
jgi:hypothetical protein